MATCLNRRRLLQLTLLSAPPAWAAGASDPGAVPRPLHVFVAGAAGGVPDTRLRWLAERLSPLLGQPIVIENKPAAGGNLAMQAAARSAPDGQTLVMMHLGTMAVNPFLYDNLGYDPLKDFVPITRVGVGPLMLAVSAASSMRSVQDLLTHARAAPGRLSFGSPGIGTPPHLGNELLKSVAKIDAQHVPYQTSTQVITDLSGGQLHWMMDGLPIILPHAQASRLRPLAVTGRSRIAALPDVPTMAEAGLPGCEVYGWTGLAAPARTPSAVIERLYGAIAKVLGSDEARQWFAGLGNEPGGETPEATAAIVYAEHAKWGALIKSAGIKPS